MGKSTTQARRHSVSEKCPECGEALVDAWCRFCGWYPKERKITLGEIRQIAFEVVEGTANPDDVKRLIQAFCDDAERGEAPPAEITAYLNTAFRAYLDGGLEIDAALSLRRPKGHPRAREDDRITRTTEFLRLRLDGMTHQDALEKMGWSATIVGQAWTDFKVNALQVLSLERGLDDRAWTPNELARLQQIFKDSPEALAFLESVS